MKRKPAFFLGLLSVILIFGFWQKKLLTNFFQALKGQPVLISPLVDQPIGQPQILGEITTWESQADYSQVLPGKDLLAKGIFVYDLSQQKIILEKNAQEKLAAASTLKIVTAAVALDKGKPDEEITVNFFPTIVGESSMNLKFGEKLTLEELLNGLLMASGNDAAETIAQGLAGQREEFIKWLNDYVKKIGVQSTHLTTPSGLDEVGQYTSAYDLFLLGKYIFNRYPKILTISTTKEKYLPASDNHRAYLIRNRLMLLTDFPFLGVKPGLGENNQMSLVALLKVKNRQILVSLIQTPSLRHDLEQIINQI